VGRRGGRHGTIPRVEAGRDRRARHREVELFDTIPIKIYPALDRTKDRPGGEVALWFPSPVTIHHLFLCITESINRYHPIPGSTDHKDFLTYRLVLSF
jgi:hypothetical protein